MKKTLKLTVIFVFLISNIFSQSDGSIDTSFNSGGTVVTDIAGYDYAKDIVVQPDNKVLVAGYYNTDKDIFVLRYNEDGSLDNSFSGNGKFTYSFGSNNEYCRGIALQDDGKIVITGGFGNGTNYDVFVIRLNSDGTFDTSFDSDGILTFALGSGDDMGYDVVIDASGKILISGYADMGSGYGFFVARLWGINGSFDTSFDGDGKATVSIDAANDFGYQIGIQSDGKIIVSGTVGASNDRDIGIASFNTDGSLNTSFNGTGTLRFSILNGDEAYGMEIQSDDKIVVGGYSYYGHNYMIMARVNPNGTLDNSFSGDGKYSGSGQADFAKSLALQEDGKILLGGNINTNPSDYAIWRFNSDGSPDYSFGTSGRVTTNVGTGDYGYAIAVHDWKIILAGNNYASTYNSFTARYYACVPPGFSNISDQTACEGNYVQFAAPATGSSPISYQWYNNGIAVGNDAPVLEFNPVTQSDDGSIYCVATNLCGSTTSNTATLTVNLPPNSTISGTADICLGDTVTLSVQAGEASYSWDSGQNTVMIDVWPIMSTSYSVTVTSLNGCTSSSFFNVDVNDLPYVYITPYTSSVCPNSVVSLNGNPSGGSGAGTYATHIWEGETSYLSSTDTQTTDFLASNIGDFQLIYTVIDSYGCTDSDTTTVTVHDNSMSYISTSACDSYTSPSGKIWTTSGIYTDTILNVNSCDSIITIDLTIIEILDQAFTATNTMFCDNGSTTIVLGSSQMDISYLLRNDLNDTIIDGPIIGTGSGLTFNTGVIDTTTNYNVYAVSSPSLYVLDLDGSNDYVSFPSLVPNSGDFSVSIWAKQNIPQASYTEVLSQGLGSGTAFYLGHNPSGDIRVGDYWPSTGINFPTDGEWHYYTIVKSSSNTLLYIDGIEVASKGSAINNPPSAEFRVGSQFGGGEYFNGRTDNLSVWDKALTNAEIQDLMNLCEINPQMGLIGGYVFEDGTGTTVIDNSGNGNDGTLMNMDPSNDWILGENNCFICETELTEIETIEVNYSDNIVDTQTACNSFDWIDANTYTSSNNTATHTLTNIFGCDSIITLNLTISNSVSDTFNIELCSNSSYTYADMTVSNNIIANESHTSVFVTSTGCDSLITENILVLNPDLVAYYPFTGNANDETGNGNNAITNNATLTNDRFGAPNEAYKFNGNNEYIEVANSSDFNFEDRGMSISFFMRVPAYPSDHEDHCLITKHIGLGASTDGFTVLISNYSNYDVVGLTYMDDGNGLWGIVTDSWDSLSDVGEWSHVVITANTTENSLYINGRHVNTVATPANVFIGDNTANLIFGKRLGYSQFDFEGSLDDIHFYKCIIDSTTIDSLYHVGGWPLQNGNQCEDFSILVEVTSDATCGNDNGTVEVTNIANGSGDYTINWSNGDIGYSAVDLAAGVSSVVVNDNILSCSVTEYFTINSIGGPTFSIDNQTNVSCNGGNNGAIVTSVSGNNPTIEWSNGSINTTINNLVAGFYDVTVTDADGCINTQSIEITQPDEILVSFTVTDADCGSANGSIVENISGGIAPYDLTWSSGTSTNLSAGTYTLTITDDNNCQNISNVNVSNTGGLEIIVDSVFASGCDSVGAIYVSVTGASGSQTYSWSNGFTGEDLINYAANIYTLTVEDGGCMDMKDIEIPNIMPNIQELCIVTVDSSNGNNLVVWEKEITTSISHYNIYRETSWPGSYLIVDSVLYDNMSEFHDPIANPMVRSWRYKISSVDICGNESPMSVEHKTIHLTINQGLGGAYNLIWDDYEGFPYGTFYIHRHLDNTGWVLIDSLPNTLHSYTDIPPNIIGLSYALTINAPNSCIPSSSVKTTGGPYSHSLSNLDDYGVGTFTNKFEIERFKIYPNPTTGIVNIEGENFEFIEISNISGQVIYKQKVNTKELNIDLSNNTKGIYFIKIISNENVSTYKIVLE